MKEMIPHDPSKPILKIVVAGSRTLDAYGDRIVNYLKKLILDPEQGLINRFNVVIVNGMATKGGDKHGGDFARQNGLWQIYMPADWDGDYKKFAGMMRNVEMAKEGHAAYVFWDGKSSGSECMLSAGLIGGCKVNEIIIDPSTDSISIKALSRGIDKWKQQ